MVNIWFQNRTRTSPFVTNTVTGQGQSQLSDRNAFVYFYRQKTNATLTLPIFGIDYSYIARGRRKNGKKKDEH